MSKLVAVQDCTIEYSVKDDPLGTVSPIDVVTPASGPIKAGNKKAYVEKISISITSGSVTLSSPPEGASSPTGTITAPGTIDIEGTAEKNTSGGDKLVLEGDEGSALFTCTFPAAPSGTVPASVEIVATVKSAGQNVAKAT